jgi:hypothetical protein
MAVTEMDTPAIFGNFSGTGTRRTQVHIEFQPRMILIAGTAPEDPLCEF